MTQKNNQIMSLIITGNPGVGKHTVANEILKNGSFQLLDINKIAIEMNHVENDSMEVDVENLKSHIQKMLTHRSLVVGHLAPYVFEQSDVELVIVLRKNPYDLIDIYKNRNYSDAKNKENTGSEILGIVANDSISTFGRSKTYEIDTTDKTTKQIIDRINEIREGGDGDFVDWLLLVKEKNDFNRFFDY